MRHRDRRKGQAMRHALRGVLVAAVFAVAACGGSDEPSTTSATPASRQPLIVSAAASLKNAFTAYGKQFTTATARFSFAGSDELAAQIEQGVTPDVYAAANTKLPDELFAKGLVERPVVFARNRLVLAVPAGERKVASLADAGRPRVTLA